MFVSFFFFFFFFLIIFLRYFYIDKPAPPFFMRFLLNLISAIIATYLFIPIVNVMLENIVCKDPDLACKYVKANTGRREEGRGDERDTTA